MGNYEECMLRGQTFGVFCFRKNGTFDLFGSAKLSHLELYTGLLLQGRTV